MEVAFGECHCGCKGKTKLHPTSNANKGITRGQPRKYLPHHHIHHERPMVEQPANPAFRRIALTQGQIATVDAYCYEWLNESFWCARWNKWTKSFYALRHGEDGKTVLMHREIVGLKHGDGRDVDHQNHDTLDNAGRNLLPCSRLKNMHNKRDYACNTSGFRGVGILKKVRSSKIYSARLRVAGAMHYLGAYESPEEASAVVEQARAEYHG